MVKVMVIMVMMKKRLWQQCWSKQALLTGNVSVLMITDNGQW